MWFNTPHSKHVRMRAKKLKARVMGRAFPLRAFPRDRARLCPDLRRVSGAADLCLVVGFASAMAGLPCHLLSQSRLY
jgi:hypothetical protein